MNHFPLGFAYTDTEGTALMCETALLHMTGEAQVVNGRGSGVQFIEPVKGKSEQHTVLIWERLHHLQ